MTVRFLQAVQSGATIVRDQGFGALLPALRRRLAHSSVHRGAWGNRYAAEAFQSAEQWDFSLDDLTRSQSRTAEFTGELDVTTINWFLPEFAHGFYGGVQTILRFAAHFAEHHQVRNTFVIVGGPAAADDATYRSRITLAFPGLSNSHTIVMRTGSEPPALPDSDAAIATFWMTAYEVLKHNNTKRKCYFLQDYEPLFYPAGSSSAQVEATYRFGFLGLTNTVTLKSRYESDFGGTATSFNPCVDVTLFHPSDRTAAPAAGRRPYKVFFYARPEVYRNGFELGAAALRHLKFRLGSDVQIVAAGEHWNPADYGLEGVIDNLGFLTYQQTAELYRTCDVGLAMMFTLHPSYLPFELMASGCMVVANGNSATSWFLKDGENCRLTLASASCIADTIEQALVDTDRRAAITGRALASIRSDFSQWSNQAEHVYAYMRNPE